MNKTIVVGDSDPRRERYFPEVEPGVELHLQLFQDLADTTLTCFSGVELHLPGLGKYNLDLFFMAPFYHRLLIHLDRVIVVDLDLEFRFDSENGFKPVQIVLRFLEQGWSYRAATSLLQT